MLSKGSLEMIAWCAAGCPLPGEQPKPDQPKAPVRIERARDATDDAVDIPDDCAGALIDPDSGGMFLAWGRT